MHKLYLDYFWKEGVPVGRQICTEEDAADKTVYKIVSDPYRKRISIEEYGCGSFQRIIYDSALFDFRCLKPAEQMAWQKTKIKENDHAVECLIRNQDDRLIIHEVYTFQNGICRECRAYSPHGQPISYQRMFYIKQSDPFNGAVLFDLSQRPVICKKYQADAKNGEFSELLEENWDMEKSTFESRSVYLGKKDVNDKGQKGQKRP